MAAKRPRKPGYCRFGLSKRHTKKSARDFVDFDYVGDLSFEEKDWLDKFSREYYQATFRSDGDNLQDTEQRRECYRSNNGRNRDVWNKSQRELYDNLDTKELQPLPGAMFTPAVQGVEVHHDVVVRSHSPNPRKEDDGGEDK